MRPPQKPQQLPLISRLLKIYGGQRSIIPLGAIHRDFLRSILASPAFDTCSQTTTSSTLCWILPWVETMMLEQSLGNWVSSLLKPSSGDLLLNLQDLLQKFLEALHLSLQISNLFLHHTNDLLHGIHPSHHANFDFFFFLSCFFLCALIPNLI